MSLDKGSCEPNKWPTPALEDYCCLDEIRTELGARSCDTPGNASVNKSCFMCGRQKGISCCQGTFSWCTECELWLNEKGNMLPRNWLEKSHHISTFRENQCSYLVLDSPLPTEEGYKTFGIMAHEQIEWLLSREEFDRAVFGFCEYCGAHPAGQVDRISVREAWCVENIVSACISCLALKRDQERPSEFLSRCFRIAGKHPIDVVAFKHQDTVLSPERIRFFESLYVRPEVRSQLKNRSFVRGKLEQLREDHCQLTMDDPDVSQRSFRCHSDVDRPTSDFDNRAECLEKQFWYWIHFGKLSFALETNCYSIGTLRHWKSVCYQKNKSNHAWLEQEVAKVQQERESQPLMPQFQRAHVVKKQTPYALYVPMVEQDMRKTQKLSEESIQKITDVLRFGTTSLYYTSRDDLKKAARFNTMSLEEFNMEKTYSMELKYVQKRDYAHALSQMLMDPIFGQKSVSRAPKWFFNLCYYFRFQKMQESFATIPSQYATREVHNVLIHYDTLLLPPEDRDRLMEWFQEFISFWETIAPPSFNFKASSNTEGFNYIPPIGGRNTSEHSSRDDEYLKACHIQRAATIYPWSPWEEHIVEMFMLSVLDPQTHDDLRYDIMFRKYGKDSKVSPTPDVRHDTSVDNAPSSAIVQGPYPDEQVMLQKESKCIKALFGALTPETMAAWNNTAPSKKNGALLRFDDKVGDFRAATQGPEVIMPSEDLLKWYESPSGASKHMKQKYGDIKQENVWLALSIGDRWNVRNAFDEYKAGPLAVEEAKQERRREKLRLQQEKKDYEARRKQTKTNQPLRPERDVPNSVPRPTSVSHWSTLTPTEKDAHKRQVRVERKSRNLSSRIEYTHQSRQHEKTQKTKLADTIVSFRRYCRNANRTCNISDDELGELFLKPCHYCGCKPEPGIGNWTGLDRIDNNKHYLKDNVLPCCCHCNMARGNRFSPEGFISHCRAISAWRNGLGCIIPEHPGWKARTFSEFASKAQKRKIAVNITNETMLALFGEPCHFCGVTPAGGIDRKENNIGYLDDNCLSCCKICNQVKRNLDYDTFVSKCHQVVKIREGLDPTSNNDNRDK